MTTLLRLQHLPLLAAALLGLFGAVLGRAGPFEDAQALIKEKKYQEAEAALTALLKDSPDNPSYSFERGKARQGLGDNPGALADYERVIQLAPNHGAVFSQRAGFRENVLKDLPGAIADYTQLARVLPGNWSPLFQRGRALEKAGAFKEALADLDRSIALKSDYGPAHVGRGVVLEFLGREDEAAASYRRALEVQPKNAAAKKNLDAILARQSGAADAPPKSTPRAIEPAVTAAAIAALSPTTAKPPPAAPPVRKRFVYKLVNIEMPIKAGPALDLGTWQTTYEGEGRNAGLQAWFDQDGHRHRCQFKWSLPAEIVPGQPAKFRMEGASADFARLYAYITINAPWTSERPLLGVRVTRNPNVGPDATVDELDLLLPDINALPLEVATGKVDRELSVRWRGEELEGIVDGGMVGGSKRPPQEVALEESRFPVRRYADEHGKPYDLHFRVHFISRRWPVAEYTYRCVERVAEGIEFATDPAGADEILADGRDGLLLKARATARSNGQPPTADATASIVFAAEGDGAAWADLSKTEVRNGWKVVFVRASDPDTVRGDHKPPAALTIGAEGKDSDRVIGGSFAVKIVPDPAIDAAPDVFEVMAKSGESLPVKIWIARAGKAPWTFRTEYAEKNRPLAVPALKPESDSAATLTLKEAGLDPEAGGASTEVSVLRIFADQPGRASLERHLKVIVGQEGVFATTVGRDPDGGFYRVTADGTRKTRDVDFRVFLQDPVKKKLANRPEEAAKLKIECLEPETSVAAQALKAGVLKWSYAGPRAANDPTGIMRFFLEKEIPGDGRIIKCDFKATYPGRDGDGFTAIFTLGLVTTSNGPGSAEWEVELKRCEDIINKFVPTAYYPQMKGILEKRKRTLGAEGLRLLREKIWRAAVELTLGEGGQGYANEAAWADHITVTLEWTEWAGDMAFGAVIGTMTGPYGATGASMLKTAVISALNAYQDGRSADEWLWENLCTIPGLVEGKVIDPAMFEKMGVQSKAKAWAIYIGYHFCKNLYNGATVVEALKNTAREVGSNVLSNWLNEKVQQSAHPPAPAAENPGAAKDKPEADGKAGAKPDAETKPAAKAGTEAGAPSRSEAEAAQRIRQATTEHNGKPYASRDAVLEVMRDPSQVRALKNAPPEVQQAFSNTREALYRQHDAEVVRHVKETVPDLKNRMVKVMEFRTPGQEGANLNTDRDYRVCSYAGRDPQTGKERWVEVDRRHWEDHSYQTFAEATGGPTDSPEAARKWADQHQQLATDKAHREASPAFTDQAKVWNPQTRQFENAQIVPNIVRVKAGQPGVSLRDPQALGQMYQMKVADAHFDHEKYVQAQKAVVELDAIRKGYGERAPGRLPPSIEKGMQAVVDANTGLAADPNRRNPKALAAANKALREHGFQNLDDFMNKLSSQFEALKLADKPGD